MCRQWHLGHRGVGLVLGVCGLLVRRGGWDLLSVHGRVRWLGMGGSWGCVGGVAPSCGNGWVRAIGSWWVPGDGQTPGGLLVCRGVGVAWSCVNGWVCAVSKSLSRVNGWVCAVRGWWVPGVDRTCSGRQGEIGMASGCPLRRAGDTPEKGVERFGHGPMGSVLVIL